MALFGGIELTGRPDLNNVRKLDLLPMPMAAEMMRYGMAIDKDWFSDLSRRLDTEIKEKRREIISYIPQDKLDEFMARSGMDEDEGSGDTDTADIAFNPNSSQQLSDLLFDILKIGAGHQLKTTKTGKLKTDKKQLERFKKEPVVKATLDYKERVKLKNTYADALPLQAKLHTPGTCWCGLNHWCETWRIHTTLISTRASTGRWASKEPNLQNIPARSELGRLIRQGFIATPGTLITDADYGQFEMRLGAHYSLDANLLRIFHNRLDPHTDTAMRAFKKTLEEVESKHGKVLYRAPCKNVNFGVFYGLSAPGLYDLMLLTYATAGIPIPDWLTMDWCKGFIEDWFELYAGVKDYMETQFYRSREYQIVWTLLGRVRRVPEIESVHPRVRAAGLRQAGNLPIQGTQADLNKLGMALVWYEVVLPMRREGIWVQPLITVHDELLLEVEEQYADFVLGLQQEAMAQCMTDQGTGVNLCAVPIVTDGKTMDRWRKE